MTGQLEVLRLGHVNQFSSDYDSAVAAQRNLFGANVFHEWEEKQFGAKNALYLVGSNCFELFAATRPDLAIGAWIGRYGEGWHSLEWAVPDLERAASVCAETGIRVTEHIPGSYLFTHPKDLFGLCLELTSALHFPDDPRDASEVTPWAPAAGPCGIVGNVTIKVAVSDGEAAATRISEVVGVTPTIQPGLGLDFPDHRLEFVGLDFGNKALGTEPSRIERLICTTYTVEDLDAAAAHLTERSTHFAISESGSLLIDPGQTNGALFELCASDHRTGGADG
jgi:hypothetical protein